MLVAMLPAPTRRLRMATRVAEPAAVTLAATAGTLVLVLIPAARGQAAARIAPAVIVFVAAARRIAPLVLAHEAALIVALAIHRAAAAATIALVLTGEASIFVAFATSHPRHGLILLIRGLIHQRK